MEKGLLTLVFSPFGDTPQGTVARPPRKDWRSPLVLPRTQDRLPGLLNLNPGNTLGTHTLGKFSGESCTLDSNTYYDPTTPGVLSGHTTQVPNETT